mmetsp:Transcript_29475/g.43530  ORF Transcript_29475/g.43530 Transcript_29475/m.43530 type:complete len:1008 (+) Transcript_29475:75-3098(+)|eukprot:CAMPEP_0194212486 /NCGR_PEP_ID=MMETSP0156-20130528/12420_1 /TAXON_ID=33649 /ORGANISM="Thalassionema nitzschioides, Strain L26-B" /LENGTH=1007 /DNA_ID=CAMNT_0038940325 /DNA_START=86 /DNA_END=3109 /DNA_ORIENTATION=-
MLRVTPIYGSPKQWDNNERDDYGPSPLGRSTLIEYGGVKVLFNVGFTANQNNNLYPPHDVLVITDGGLESMGGLPVYYKQQQKSADTNNQLLPRMCATFPTVKMGQMMLYDHHASLCMDGMKCPYTLEELDASTSALQTLKYSQTISVQVLDEQNNTNQVLELTAHRSGHAVGGAYFILKRVQDDTVVVVTSHNYHVARELHLDSSSLLQYGATPDVLITAPGGPSMGYLSSQYYTGMKQPQPVVTQAETNLVDTVMAVLRRDGNVLIPCDASGRVLELLLVLHQQWERQRLSQTYHLVWLGPMVHNTLEFARCQLEWMAIRLGSQFDSLKGHPYALPHVTLCTSMTELETLLAENPETPTCVLASGLSLDHGCARNVFLQWADQPDNAIIITDSSQASLRRDLIASSAMDVLKTNSQLQHHVTPEDDHVGIGIGIDDHHQGQMIVEDADIASAHKNILTTTSISEWTTSAQLLRHWVQAKVQGKEMDDVVEVNVLVPCQQPLRGSELLQFQQKEERRLRQSQLYRQEQAMLREVELAKGQLRLDDNEGNNMNEDGMSKASSSPMKRSYPLSSALKKKKSRFDSSLFMKFSKPLHLTFEFREEAVGIGQTDSVAKYGIGEGRQMGDVLEDEYGIAVGPDFFQDIVTGVDPSKFQQKTVDPTKKQSDKENDNALLFSTGKEEKDGAHHAGGENTEGPYMSRAILEAQDLSEGSGIIRGRQGRPPMKVSLVPRTVEVLCEVHYIPLEGRGDARAARNTIRALQPRQVVLMGGGGGGTDEKNKEANNNGDDDNEKSFINNEVALLAQSLKCPHKAPSDGETAELSVGHAAYSVRLIDTPLATTTEQTTDEDDENKTKTITTATTRRSPTSSTSSLLLEQTLGACTVSRFDFVGTGKKVALEDSIVLAPSSGITGTTTTKQQQQQYDNNKAILVSDGDVLLTELRAELTAQGFKAEYSSGKIVVNGKIMVEKTTTKSSSSSSQQQLLQVEGPLCEDFFTVRSLVCGQFVTL